MHIRYDEKEEYLKKEMEAAKITAVFGASDAGRDFIESMHGCVDCVIDNRAGSLKQFCGLPVYPVDHVADMGETDVIIVTSRSFWNIARQLEKTGYRGRLYSQNAVKIRSYFHEDDLEKEGVAEFVDCRCGHENLLMVVAGFQPYYWDDVLLRVKENQKLFDEKLDVCICVPNGGGDSTALKNKCVENGWSFFHIDTNQLAKAQNIAILLHPEARWIYKIDEDIILPRDYFGRMKREYPLAEEHTRRNIGFLAPVLNINFCGTEVFFNTLDLVDGFEKEFGRLIYGWNEAPFYSGEAGRWIWEHSIPFDRVAKTFETGNALKYHFCDLRFSVGAFLCERTFWIDLGGFTVAPEGILGVEEIQMNEKCINAAMSMVIAESIFAGHMGYGSQKDAIREFYEEHRTDFGIGW